MKKNMGTVDRAIRIGLAVIGALLYFAVSIPGSVALILVIVVVMLLLTSTVAFCPLYVPFKISTRRKYEQNEQ